MGETLLPCPFCGEEARLFGGPEAQETYSIWCDNRRGKRHHLECGTMNKKGAISEWNTRSGDLIPRDAITPAMAAEALANSSHAAAIEAAVGCLQEAVDDWRSQGLPETDKVAQRIEDEIPGIRALHTDASRDYLAERDERIKREAREEALKEAAELAFEADDCFLARNAITALIEKEGE